MNRQSCPFQNWMPKGLDCQYTCISNEQTVLSISELNAKGRTGLPMYMYIKWTDSPVHSTTAQYRQTRSLSAASSPVSLTTWMVEGLIMMARIQYKGKGCCSTTEQCCETQNQLYQWKARLLHQKLLRQKLFGNPWRNTFESFIAHHFQLWSNTESRWVSLCLTLGYGELWT